MEQLLILCWIRNDNHNFEHSSMVMDLPKKLARTLLISPDDINMQDTRFDNPDSWPNKVRKMVTKRHVHVWIRRDKCSFHPNTLILHLNR